MKDIVRVWIGNPFDGGNFNGTAFFIDRQTLVTAKHVVTNKDSDIYNNIFISNTQDAGTIPIDEVILCDRDLALLKIKKMFDILNVSFTDNMKEGNKVNVIGFFDKSSSFKSYENHVIGHQSSEHTFELQNHLTHGLSGSPVFLDEKICGVAKAINSSKNLTYVIPISELCIEEGEKYYKKEEMGTKTPISLTNKIAIGSMLSGLLIGLMPYIEKYMNPQWSIMGETSMEEKNIPISSPWSINKLSTNKDGEYIIYSESKKVFFKNKNNANNIIKFTLDNKVHIYSIPDAKPMFQYMLVDNKVLQKAIVGSSFKNFNNQALKIREESSKWYLYSDDQRIFMFPYQSYAKKAKELIVDKNLSTIYFLENFAYLG